jgi:hypothetical protein
MNGKEDHVHTVSAAMKPLHSSHVAEHDAAGQKMEDGDRHEDVLVNEGNIGAIV